MSSSNREFEQVDFKELISRIKKKKLSEMKL